MLKPLIHIIFFTLIAFIPAHATHFMGGDVSYKRLNNGLYEITFTIYEDCNGTATVGARLHYYIAERGNSNRASNYALRISESSLTNNRLACALQGYCVNVHVFKDTVELAKNLNGFYVYYSACCRNNAISSLVKSVNGQANQGQVWHAQIPPIDISNSSPIFLSAPIPFLCVGKTTVFNHGVFDPDGDSLAFSLSVPKSNGGTPPFYRDVIYEQGYSVTHPFGTSSPKIEIDPVTGEITATSNSLGNYVVAIEVNEYRVDPFTNETIFLGKVVRDLQFIVVACNDNPPPVFLPDPAGPKKSLKVGETFCFTVSATDGLNTNVGAEPYDTLVMTANGGMLESSYTHLKPPYATFPDAIGYQTVSSEFCWTPSCHHITYTSPYVLSVLVEDGGCNIIQKTYSIYVEPLMLYQRPLLKCMEANDSTSVKLFWQVDTPYSDFGMVYVYKRKGTAGPFNLYDSISDPASTEYIDFEAIGYSSTSYQYYIRIRNQCGILGLSSDTLSSTDYSFTTLTAPELRVVSVNPDNSISVKWTTIPGEIVEKYEIYYSENNGQFVYAGNLPEQPGQVNEYTHTGINPQVNSYCYFIKAIKKCSGEVSTSSVTHCAINLSAKQGHFAGIIEWTPYAGFSVESYTIERNYNNAWDHIAVVPGNITNYIDSGLQCHKTYSYRVFATEEGGYKSISYSDTAAVIAITQSITKPNPVYLKFASVAEANHIVHLGWERADNPEAAKYRVYRKQSPHKEGTHIHTTQNINQQHFYDSVHIQEGLCYYVIVEDYCGRLSLPSNYACPIILSGKHGNFVNHISWKPYRDWQEGAITYQIFESEDHTDWVEAAIVEAHQLTFTDEYLTDYVKDYCYQIKAIEKGGSGSEAYSTVVCLHQEPLVFIPNSFTPGISPDLNDGFAPKGMYIAAYEITIYNRWGGLIYKTPQNTPWSGNNSHENRVPPGSYVYLITIYSYNGNILPYTGTVTILE